MSIGKLAEPYVYSRQNLNKLILPGSLQAIFTGLRLGMGMSWRALVAAEMLASSAVSAI